MLRRLHGQALQVAKALGEGLVAALSADAYLTKLTAAKPLSQTQY
jgi:thioredoxin reductase